LIATSRVPAGKFARATCVAMVLAAAGAVMLAQQASVQVAPAAGLKVSSIKVSQQNVGGSINIQPGGRIVMTNVRVRDFVNMVYSSNPPLLTQQIVDLPPWASVIRYNIEAKFSTDGFDNTFDGKRGTGPYVRAILEQRFAFKAHLEKRELPVYLLTVTDASKLRPSTIDCKNPDNQKTCWGYFGSGRGGGPAEELSGLVSDLGYATGRPVVDRTGTSGLFDIDLQWNPDPLDTTDTRPTIFGAVAEYGLKLESSRATADVLVIDHLERPAEN
jgi:uncharacterized protein (TIGR03435 family)